MVFGKFFAIKSSLTGLALDVEGVNYAVGTHVAPYDYHGGDNQLWYEDTIEGVIRSKGNDDYVLDVMGDTLCINTLSPNDYNQNWRLAGDRIENVQNPATVLDIANADPSPGARVNSWEFNGGHNQLWDFEFQAPQYMFIVTAMNGKVLDIDEANPDPGTKVIMYDRNMGDNQIWYEGMGGIIYSKLNDMTIDLGALGENDDAYMVPYDPGNHNAQLVKCGDKIENREDHRVLDIKERDDWDGAKLCGYEFNGQDNQQWVFEYI